jgi:hypothetical protein
VQSGNLFFITQKGTNMFKLLKLAPMLWMAYRWYRGQKTGGTAGGAYKAGRYSDRGRNTWR